MIDGNSLNNLFKSRYKIIGDLSGELFDIYRPDYSVQDNLPEIMVSGTKYRLGIKEAKSFAQPFIFGASYYDIFGNRDLVQSGDMIIRGSLDSPDLTFPAVTVSHFHNLMALEGFRSSRRAHIVNSYNEDTKTFDYVYQNIFFDMLGVDRPHGELTTNYAHSGEEIPSQRAIIYHRQGIDQEGMQLIETDYSGTPNGNKWFITQINDFGPTTELVLSANWKR